MLAAFVVVGAEPAVAQLPVECHGAPYVYKNVTVYKVHTDNIDCHTAYGHIDVLVDRHNAGYGAYLAGFGCTTHVGVPSTRLHVHCTNTEHSHHQFDARWLTHPPTICPAAASTPASSVFTRIRGV
jgi:hypothetical protein